MGDREAAFALNYWQNGLMCERCICMSPPYLVHGIDNMGWNVPAEAFGQGPPLCAEAPGD